MTLKANYAYSNDPFKTSSKPSSHILLSPNSFLSAYQNETSKQRQQTTLPPSYFSIYSFFLLPLSYYRKQFSGIPVSLIYIFVSYLQTIFLFYFVSFCFTVFFFQIRDGYENKDDLTFGLNHPQERSGLGINRSTFTNPFLLLF